MSRRTRATLARFSFPLTGALFTLLLLATFGQALAGEGDEGGYYYDRYALPWVKKYAPPDTAPGTYGGHSDHQKTPHDTGDQE